MVAAEGNGSKNVLFVARHDDANRDLAIIGAVGGIESAAARVEANLAAKVAAESGFKRGGVELRGMGRRWGDVLRHSVQTIFEDAGVARKGIAEVRGQIAEGNCSPLDEEIVGDRECYGHKYSACNHGDINDANRTPPHYGVGYRWQ